MSAALSVTTPPHDGLFGGARHKAMFAVALSVLLSVLDYAVVNVALPSIARDIHTDASSAIWVVNAYQLASVISLLPLAAMGDECGTKETSPRRRAPSSVSIMRCRTCSPFDA